MATVQGFSQAKLGSGRRTLGRFGSPSASTAKKKINKFSNNQERTLLMDHKAAIFLNTLDGLKKIWQAVKKSFIIKYSTFVSSHF